MSETPTTQLLALFQANDLHFDSAEDAWARARGGSQAMVTAWLEHQGLGSKDNPGRQKAQGELLDLLRQARQAGGLAET
ncbi:hypothetical protein HUA78_16390 [Myxococcus sp. CA033]|uniref:hypothetical protein n=1 Tax=Myxococcus sp. CA033 TaxID=2741516 RepID=UPI00157B64B2|nr:hypothetical protein [Myxococcus sp. CA033]NTX36027.1 hypothetical protein [Myxococcus sp. CA033]